MTLENMLRTKLADPAASAGRHDMALTHHGWTVTLTVERGDAFSSLLWEVALRRDTPRPGDLKGWADDVAGRATGLLEPLKLLEVDEARLVALLRSAVPTAADAGLNYYEVLLAPASAQLRRYQGYTTPVQPRQQIAFTLTHEALAKLLRDVTGEK
jgi:hypothetical protein